MSWSLPATGYGQDSRSESLTMACSNAVLMAQVGTLKKLKQNSSRWPLKRKQSAKQHFEKGASARLLHEPRVKPRHLRGLPDLSGV